MIADICAGTVGGVAVVIVGNKFLDFISCSL
jgi:hypothetical protein